MNIDDYNDYLVDLYNEFNESANSNNIISLNINIKIDFDKNIKHCDIYLKIIDFNYFNNVKTKKRLIIFNNQSIPNILFNPSYTKFYQVFTNLMDDLSLNKD